MFTVFDLVTYAGALFRVLGMLVFGVAAGWFLLHTYRQAAERWQLQIAIFLGFFFFVAATIRFTSAAGIGAFALGAGAAMLFWGLRKPTEADPDEAAETED